MTEEEYEAYRREFCVPQADGTWKVNPKSGRTWPQACAHICLTIVFPFAAKLTREKKKAQRDALQKAFDATPAELGAAAVKHARRF